MRLVGSCKTLNNSSGSRSERGRSYFDHCLEIKPRRRGSSSASMACNLSAMARVECLSPPLGLRRLDEVRGSVFQAIVADIDLTKHPGKESAQ